MNFISERIKVVSAGFKSIPDLAIEMNQLEGPVIIIYILCQSLSIAELPRAELPPMPSTKKVCRRGKIALEDPRMGSHRRETHKFVQREGSD
jgi:hypothetical protein